METLGVGPGSVTAFGLINDREGRDTPVLDAGLLTAAVVNCHPLANTATTSIAPQDLLAFIRATGHEPQIVDFALTLDEAAAEPRL
jgi:Ala-tRNA(Pro) deacylase